MTGDAAPPTAPTPPGTSPGKRAGRPRGKQLLVLLVGGPLIAVGGCALFLGNLNFNSGNAGGLGVLGAIGFVVGCGMVLVGFMIAIAMAAQAILNRQKT